MSRAVFALSARYVLPIDAPPLREASVIIDGDRIVAVVPGIPTVGALQLGNAVILPGLVNAHTHLEFSDLQSPLGKAGIRFSDWIAEVIHWRRSLDTDPNAARDWRAAAIQKGIEESLRAGVTTLGDIATFPFSSAAYGLRGPHVVAFAECLGLTPQRAAEQEALVRQHMAADRPASPGVVWGLSPHAPYTVRWDLLCRLCAWSAARSLPVAMHVAESREELDLLRSADGPLWKLLMQLNAWDPSAVPCGARPADYLRQLALAHRALVIHGNYLAPEEFEFLALHADHMAVVYCPRTHDHCGHGAYPLREMLAAGVTLALGTDSRASSSSLDLLDDMRLVARQYADLPHATIVRLATLGGATALGRAPYVGSLTPGKRADVIAISLPESGPDDPHAFLADARCRVERVYQAGTQVFTSGNC